MSAPATLAAVRDSASAFYRSAGRFGWHFARGKLGGDPIYRALLEHGLLAGRERLLDLGAGQGLVAAWLLAAYSRYVSERAGPWPHGWPVPPQLREYTGIDINAREVQRARRAFARDAGAQLQFVHADFRDVDYGHPDAIVLLDVLHYVDYAAQERVLARAATALARGGLLLLRVGDAEGGLSFRLSKAVDRTVVLLRRGRLDALHCRPLRAWRTLLTQHGFSVRAVPMSGGTYVNTLLLGERA